MTLNLDSLASGAASSPNSLGSGRDPFSSADWNWWDVMTFVLLPTPILMILLLSVPAPRVVRRIVLTVVERFLSAEVRQYVTISHFALLVSGG